MRIGARARREAAEQRNAGAMAIGHAILDLDTEVQSSVMQLVLAEALRDYSRFDLLLTMGELGIGAGRFQGELSIALTKEAKRLEKAQINAKAARQELQNKRLLKEKGAEFRAWLDSRSATKDGDPS